MRAMALDVRTTVFYVMIVARASTQQLNTPTEFTIYIFEFRFKASHAHAINFMLLLLMPQRQTIIIDYDSSHAEKTTFFFSSFLLFSCSFGRVSLARCRLGDRSIYFVCILRLFFFSRFSLISFESTRSVFLRNQDKGQLRMRVNV